MTKKIEVSMLKSMYLFVIIWNVLGIISFTDYSSFVQYLLPLNAIALLTLKFGNVLENLGILYLRLRTDKEEKK